MEFSPPTPNQPEKDIPDSTIPDQSCSFFDILLCSKSTFELREQDWITKIVIVVIIIIFHFFIITLVSSKFYKNNYLVYHFLHPQVEPVFDHQVHVHPVPQPVFISVVPGPGWDGGSTGGGFTGGGFTGGLLIVVISVTTFSVTTFCTT